MSLEAWGDEDPHELPMGCVSEESYDELEAECRDWQEACAKLFLALNEKGGLESMRCKEAMALAAQTLRDHSPRSSKDRSPAWDKDRVAMNEAAALAEQMENLRLDAMYADRLSELAKIVVEEGISPISEGSRDDFFGFLRMQGYPVRRAALTLGDDGNLCAIWDDDSWRLSLRFRGQGRVHYVLLKRRDPPKGKSGEGSLWYFDVRHEGFVAKKLLEEANDG